MLRCGKVTGGSKPGYCLGLPSGAVVLRPFCSSGVSKVTPWGTGVLGNVHCNGGASFDSPANKYKLGDVVVIPCKG